MVIVLIDDSKVEGKRRASNFIQPSGKGLQPMVFFLQFVPSRKDEKL